MAEEDDLFKAATEVAATQAAPFDESIHKILDRIFKGGMTPKDAMGISDEMMEAIYSHAYLLYNSGKYREASQIFHLLSNLNSVEPRYLMGLAASYQMAKEYDSAIMTYTLLTIFNPKDPLPHYHLSDCYLKVELYAMALVELKKAIECCGDLTEYGAIKDRALLSVDGIQKQLEESITGRG